MRRYIVDKLKLAAKERRVLSSCFSVTIFSVVSRGITIGASTSETLIFELLLVPVEILELQDYTNGRTMVDSYRRSWEQFKGLVGCNNKGDTKVEPALAERRPSGIAHELALTEIRKAFFADLVVIYGVGEAVGVCLAACVVIMVPVNFSEVAGAPLETKGVLINTAITLVAE